MASECRTWASARATLTLEFFLCWSLAKRNRNACGSSDQKRMFQVGHIVVQIYCRTLKEKSSRNQVLPYVHCNYLSVYLYLSDLSIHYACMYLSIYDLSIYLSIWLSTYLSRIWAGVVRTSQADPLGKRSTCSSLLKGSWDLVTRVIKKVAILIITYNPN